MEVVNIGSGTSYKIDQIAKKIAALLGISKLEIITSDEHRRTSDIPRFVCDNTKLCQLTGWTPAISIEDGLSKTVEWFKDHNSRWNFSQNDRVNPVRSDEPVLQTARR